MSACANLELVKQMNKISDQQLAQLYRRMTKATGPGDLDGRQLLDCLQGDLADAERDAVLVQVAGSSATADAARMLNALAADSSELAAKVGALKIQQAPTAVHTLGRRQRVANGRRSVRVRASWLSVAACLVAIVGVWNMGQTGGDGSDKQLAQPASAQPDVIFASNDRIFASATEARAAAEQDRLFSSRFAGS